MTRRVVAVAASAGGIEALQAVLRHLPTDIDAPLLVVLHLAPGAGSALPKILERAGPLPATAAIDGETMEPRHIYVCVPDRHLLVGDGHLHVRPGPRENGHRPAADPLFRSAAYYYGPDAIGVILSGTLSDGTAGLHAIRNMGGLAIVQDPTDAMYPSMPASALEFVGADHVVPADQIAGVLVKALEQRDDSPVSPAPPADLEKEVALMEHDDRVVDGNHPGIPSPWPCPDCNGVLWQIEEGNIVRFRCRVGHAWAAHDLLHMQGTAVEAALWMALRSLEDRASLSRTLAERAMSGNRPISANRFLSDMDDYAESARVLRELLDRHGSQGDD